MKDATNTAAVTCATLANAAELTALIAKNVISGNASQTFDGMSLEENQIIGLAQSVFQAEIMKKLGV